MKNKIKLVIIVGIVIILIGIICLFIAKENKNNKIVKENMEIINNSYEDLEKNVITYNEIRNEYNTLLKDFYLDSYQEKQEEYTNLLNRYNEVIKNIDSNILKINDKCNMIYSEININKICNSYERIYEKLINLYVSDVTNYNDKVTEYNEYKKESIPLFDMIHTDYIDYNNDSVYEGRDSSYEK